MPGVFVNLTINARFNGHANHVNNFITCLCTAVFSICEFFRKCRNGKKQFKVTDIANSVRRW